MESLLCARLGNNWATIVMLWAIPLALFLCIGFAQMAVELCAPHVIVHAKMQPTVRISPGDYSAAWRVAARNWGIALLFAIAQVFVVMPHVGGPPLCGSSERPSWLVMGRDFIVFLAVEEVLFYYSHRALHEVGYAAIHKFHHNYTAPFGIAAVYAHPVEHVLSNVLPAAMGPLLMRRWEAATWQVFVT